MALYVKWSSGDQIWYDGTQHVLTIKSGTDGLEIGEDDYGVPFKFYGATANAFMNWNSTGDRLDFDLADIAIGETDNIYFGDANELGMAYDGTQFVLLPASSGLDMHFGSAAKPLDVVNYGNITHRAPTTVATTGGAEPPTLTVGITDNRFQFVDTTGAKNILLPSASGETAIGIQYFIANASTGSNTLSVYNGTSGEEIIAEIAQFETGILVNDGVQWRGIAATAT